MAKKEQKKTLSQRAAEFIAEHEGFSEKAYKDRTQYSYGFGTKAPGPDAKITKEEALEKLEKNAQAHLDKISKIKGLNDNQKIALTSLSYNIGSEAFGQSSLKGMIDRGQMKKAKSEFKNWVYQSGKKLKGLERRRAEESSLFLPDDDREEDV